MAADIGVLARGDGMCAPSNPYWSFEPDRERAAALTAEIDRRLQGSLRYIFEEFCDRIDPDGRFAGWIGALERARRPDPLVHLLFHTLVAAIETGDDEEARRIADRLLTLGGAPEDLAIRPVEHDPASDRPVGPFSRFADLEEANRLDLTVPDPGAVAAATTPIAQGLDLVRRNDPGLDAEFRAFVTDILLVGQAPGHTFTTAAVSCFQNWGALLVNAGAIAAPLDAVEQIAHEATHLLLFGVALDEPLLTNPPEELHYSPLREAPRSMDGVYHATIVAARVMRAMLRQARAKDGEQALVQEARERAQWSAQLFQEGVAVIEAGARLTPLGRAVLEDCKAAVEALNTSIARAD